MTLWIIEPRDPLIVRDGRPFGPNPGARAQSLPFPFPSTIAGAVRSQDGKYHNNGLFPRGDEETINRILSIGICGPLLVELDPQGNLDDWLLPAPSDALLLQSKNEEEVWCRRLVPLKLKDEDQTEIEQELAPVGVTPYQPGKPAKKPPRYWSWEKAFLPWLIQPEERIVSRDDLGHDGPEREERMHVHIQPETQTAQEGYLFLTSGLEFRRADKKENMSFEPVHRLGLAIETAAQMNEGVAPLGGERRLMYWRRSGATLPTCPTELVEQIASQQACRLLLLTPAYFNQGWFPEWILHAQDEIKITVEAVSIRNSQTVSGWDYKIRKPKPSLRLAPAGTVYFLKLDGAPDAVRSWIEQVWMNCISDDEQKRRDGFGLAVFGTWSGALTTLEIA